MIEHFQWRGSAELVLRHGAGSPVTVIMLPALFEEANRMRRFTVSVMRMLAERGIGSVLPDLPGTGESLLDLCDVPPITLNDWSDFIANVAAGTLLSLSFRGGCLLDSAFPNRWRLAPETGERLLRDMVRATAFNSEVSTSDLDVDARLRPTRLVGHSVGPDLYRALDKAVPVEGAFVSKVEGPKLWRQAEPGDDPHYAAAVADEIAAWIKTCAVT